MILGSSLEFEKGHNNEIVNRVTDNEELPTVSQSLYDSSYSMLSANILDAQRKWEESLSM